MLSKKEFKKISMVLFIFLILCSISTVFAEDLEASDYSGSDFIISDSINLDSSDSSNSLDSVCSSLESSDSDSLEESPSNIDLSANPSEGKIKTNLSETEYNDLKTTLDSNSETDDYIVYLGEGVYTNSKSGSYDLGAGETNTKININDKKIQFIGMGADRTFIDGTNTDWLFNISFSSISFVNLSLVNAYSTGNISAVIYSDYSNLDIINCSVNNNKVELFDGSSSFSPIYFESARNKDYLLNISGSNFTNNSFIAHNYTGQYGPLSKATDGGVLTLKGAIAVIQDSVFENTYANSENAGVTGGVIYIFTNGQWANITNCTFINASANKGGAIGSNYGGNMTIDKCKFINLTAIEKGSAVYSNDYGSGFSYEAFVFIGNNEFDNCHLTNGSTDYISVTGAHEIHIDNNITISIDNNEFNYGEDRDLTITVTDKDGNLVSSGSLNITLVGPDFSSTYPVSFNNGIGTFNVKDLALGIYNATINYYSATENASFKTQLKIKSEYTYSLVMNPSHISVQEGEPVIINGTLVDEYGILTKDLDGTLIWINWTTYEGTIRVLTGSYMVQNGKFSFDLSNLELWPREEEYLVNFDLQYNEEFNPFATVADGFCYVKVIEVLPDHFDDIDIIYVDAINGHDDSGNGTEANPVKSLQVALNMNHELGGNKLIILKEGEYTISKYALRDKVTVLGEDPSKVTISQTGGKRGMFEILGNVIVKFDNISFTKGNSTVVPFGAVFSNEGNSTLIINNSVFYNNTGFYGGVINNDGENANLIIENSLFQDNYARQGGVIYASNGNLNIFNSSFINNTGRTGGVLYLMNNAKSLIENCSFADNKAIEDQLRVGGGAIAVSTYSLTEIKYSTFINNYAKGYGGAIWAFLGNVDVYGSIFINNTASAEGSTIAADINEDTVVNVSNSVLFTSDRLHSLIYVPDESGSIVYADNNWWGNNSRPSLTNVNMSSRILMTLVNDEDDNVCVALNSLSDGSIFDGYLPVRTVIFSPADKFDNATADIAGGELHVPYHGDILNDEINATIDNQLLTLHYQYYPEIDSNTTIDDIEAVYGSEVIIIASVSSGDIKIEDGYVDFYLDNTFLGSSPVNDGVASLTIDVPSDIGVYEILAVFSGDATYKSSRDTANLIVTGQIASKFIAENVTLNVGDKYYIQLVDIRNNPLANKTVSFDITVNGQTTSSNKTTDENGFIEFELSPNQYAISGSFIGDSNYLASSFSASVNVSKMETSLTIDESSGVITIKLVNKTNNAPLSSKSIYISVIDGKGNINNYNKVTNANGIVNFNLENGNYFIFANFTGDEVFNNTSASRNIIINDSGDVPSNDTDNETVPVIHTGDDARDIQTAIDNADDGAIIDLGEYNYTDVSDLNITKNITLKGNNTVISTKEGSRSIFNIPSKDENGPDIVNIEGIEFKLNNGDVLVLTAARNDTNPLKVDVASINIKDNIFDTANDDVVSKSITILEIDSERAVLSTDSEIIINNNQFVAGMKPFDFVITSIVDGFDVNISDAGLSNERIETQIVYENMTTTAVDVDTDGRVGEYFYITLKDKNGNLLKNKPIQIGFNGVVYDRTTDGNGSARLQINLKNAGTYTFAVSYLGDDEYNGSFIVAKIVVNKQKGSLTVPAKSYKASASTKTLTATFKSASGKVVKGKKITFTVNGKSYSATTNAKGVATVKVSLNTKGTYSFTAKFAGNTMYAAISKTAKLTIK